MAKGRNLGLAHAEGNIIAFTDDDCLPAKDWLREIEQSFERNPHAIGVEGKTITIDSEITLFTSQIVNTSGEAYQTCNIAYKKEKLQKIGGFDEAFILPHGEDVDLALRMLKNGPISFEPNVVVVHPPRPSTFQREISRAQNARAEIYLFKKHPSYFYTKYGHRNLFFQAVFVNFLWIRLFHLKYYFPWIKKNVSLYILFAIRTILEILYLLLLVPKLYLYYRSLRIPRGPVPKQMSIVFAATGISSKACDLYLNTISERLRKKGHTVWLVCVNPDPRVPLKPYHIPVTWVEPKSKLLRICFILFPYFHDRSMSKAVASAVYSIREPIDIVNMEIPSLLYCYKKRGKEIIVTRGWYYPHHLLARLRIMSHVAPAPLLQKGVFLIQQFWFYWGDAFGFKRADALVTLTQDLAYQLSRKGFHATYVPLGITVPPFQRRDNKIITLGMTAYDLENPRKGIQFLLQTIHYIETKQFSKNPYIIELIGGYSSVLTGQIHSLGLQKKIKLLGRLEHQQTIKQMTSWDIFVFPTLFEELSLATIEAMSLGLVCVGWDIDSLRAAWGKDGILIRLGDTKRLSSELVRLINDENLRKKRSYRLWKRAKNEFDWKIVIQKLEKLFKQIH